MVYSWESGEACPHIRHVPKIIQFLGYSPFPPSERTLPEALRGYRLKNGLTQGSLAKILDVDRGTVSTWERGRFRPRGRTLAKIQVLLEE